METSSSVVWFVVNLTDMIAVKATQVMIPAGGPEIGALKVTSAAAAALWECMDRRPIASRIFVEGGVVCSSVFGVFVESSFWPQWSLRTGGL